LTTVDAAPFGFFNCLSADPPILALGVESHPDPRFKDTAPNIGETEVFTDERLRVDPAAVDAIARLGGDTRGTIHDRFDMATPTLAGWRVPEAPSSEPYS
jgi:flavin reductase (DIM6/NTAB) family NADH-FMN oxidoreductase RutF